MVRLRQKRYEASAKGKATKRRYNASAKGHAADRRYSATPKGHARRMRYYYDNRIMRIFDVTRCTDKKCPNDAPSGKFTYTNQAASR